MLPALGAIAWTDVLSGIGKFIAGNWKWIALGLLLWSWHSRGERIEELERVAEGYDNAITTLDVALTDNRKAILECESINRANAEEWANVQSQIETVEAEAAVREHNLEERLKELYEQEDGLRAKGPVCMVPEYLARRVRKPAP